MHDAASANGLIKLLTVLRVCRTLMVASHCRIRHLTGHTLNRTTRHSNSMVAMIIAQKRAHRLGRQMATFTAAGDVSGRIMKARTPHLQ